MITKKQLQLGDILITACGYKYVLVYSSILEQNILVRHGGYMKLSSYEDDLQDLANNSRPVEFRKLFKVLHVYRPKSEYKITQVPLTVFPNGYEVLTSLENSVNIDSIDNNFIPLKALV